MAAYLQLVASRSSGPLLLLLGNPTASAVLGAALGQVLGVQGGPGGSNMGGAGAGGDSATGVVVGATGRWVWGYPPPCMPAFAMLRRGVRSGRVENHRCTGTWPYLTHQGSLLLVSRVGTFYRLGRVCTYGIGRITSALDRVVDTVDEASEHVSAFFKNETLKAAYHVWATCHIAGFAVCVFVDKRGCWSWGTTASVGLWRWCVGQLWCWSWALVCGPALVLGVPPPAS